MDEQVTTAHEIMRRPRTVLLHAACAAAVCNSLLCALNRVRRTIRISSSLSMIFCWYRAALNSAVIHTASVFQQSAARC